MAEQPGGPRTASATVDYTQLPAQVRLDETVVSVPPTPAPEPYGGRNVDQDQALRAGG